MYFKFVELVTGQNAMNSSHQKKITAKAMAWLASPLFGGLLIGLPTASVLAQVSPNTNSPATSSPAIQQDGTAPLNQTPPVNNNSVQNALPEVLPENSGIRVPPRGPVTVTLLNSTASTVAFRLATESPANETTTMGMLEGTGVTLTALQTPFSMTFVRRDGSFLQVTPRVVSPSELQVVLSDPTSAEILNNDRSEGQQGLNDNQSGSQQNQDSQQNQMR
jgi:hypothetical protein